MKRIHFKKQIIFKYKFNITILLIVIVTFSIFRALQSKIINVVKIYAVNEMTNIATNIITDSIYSHSNMIKNKNILSVLTDSEGQIVSIDFDSASINDVLVDINSDIISSISDINVYSKDKDGLYYIPYGIVSGNAIFSDLGPKIPIKTRMIGSVKSNVNTSVEPYGINNSMIKVSVNIELYLNLIMPFVLENIKVSNDVLLVCKIVEGKVPPAYIGTNSIRN